MSMTVKEAQEKCVCRLCGESVSFVGQPIFWKTEFGKRMFPGKILVLNFGEEFAHEACLAKENDNVVGETR